MLIIVDIFVCRNQHYLPLPLNQPYASTHAQQSWTFWPLPFPRWDRSPHVAIGWEDLQLVIVQVFADYGKHCSFLSSSLSSWKRRRRNGLSIWGSTENNTKLLWLQIMFYESWGKRMWWRKRVKTQRRIQTILPTGKSFEAANKNLEVADFCLPGQTFLSNKPKYRRYKDLPWKIAPNQMHPYIQMKTWWSCHLKLDHVNICQFKKLKQKHTLLLGTS